MPELPEFVNKLLGRSPTSTQSVNAETGASSSWWSKLIGSNSVAPAPAPASGAPAPSSTPSTPSSSGGRRTRHRRKNRNK